MSPRQLLTSSRFSSWRSCARKHFYKYEERLRPVRDSPEAKFGTLCHRGLESWWTQKANEWHVAAGAGPLLYAGDATPLEAALATVHVHAERSPDQDPIETARAEVLLTAYDLRWKNAPLQPLAVEAEFCCPFINPATGRRSPLWDLAGKLDVLVRNLEDGRVYIVEHKTTTKDISEGSGYWQRLRMDGQVTIYFEGGKSLGNEVYACIYDVLRRPLHRRLAATPEADRKYRASDGKLYANQRETDESIDDYKRRVFEDIAREPESWLKRGNVVRFDEEMNSHLIDLWDVAHQLRRAQLSGRHPRNPDACDAHYRLCEYFDICTGVADPTDPHLYQVREKVHPELAIEGGTTGKEE